MICLMGEKLPHLYSIYDAATSTPLRMFAEPDVVPDSKNVAISLSEFSTTYGSVLRSSPSSFLPSLLFEAALPDS